MSRKCSHGYTTSGARADWIRAKGIKHVDESLVANSDVKKPLYFWQIYSLIGLEKIEQIIEAFYTRVYQDDKNPWFRDAFTRISDMDHHVATQTAFWADAFGGGRQYHGGEFRLRFHHTNNAASVMTAAGATRWMHHMTQTLNEDMDWKDTDPRVKPCIVDFLKVRMEKYARDHHWKYNGGDFDDLCDVVDCHDENIGKQGTLKDLTLKSIYNGKRVRLVGWYSKGERYTVRLPDGDTIRIKPENIDIYD